MTAEHKMHKATAHRLAAVKAGRKKVWLAAVLVFAVAAVICWVVWPRQRAQFITLADGRMFRLAGVTLGTNHHLSQPIARLVARLPASWAEYIHSKSGNRWRLPPPVTTAEPSLCVWLRFAGIDPKASKPRAGQFVSLNATLADDDGDLAGGACGQTVGPSTGWIVLQFSQWPRRSRELECRVQQESPGTPIMGTVIRVRFPNPRPGRFPQWQPEPLPAVKSAGDLGVRLEKLVTTTNTGNFNLHAETRFSLAFTAPRNNETWVVDQLELADATGNRLTNGGYYGGSLSVVQGALWPDESAVRLKLQLKKASGFVAADLITFSNIPLSASAVQPATTGISVTNFAGTVPVVLRNYVTGQVGWQPGSPPGPYWLELEPPAATNDLAVDFVEVMTDTGQLPTEGARGGNWREYKTVPPGTKSLTVTIAVQKKRHVEFLAKPVPE